MESHFITKTFIIGYGDSIDVIDDWLNGLTVQFDSVDIVGYASTMNGVCITCEVELNEREIQ